LKTLIGSADVFMENLNPSKLKALSIDEHTLRTQFPRLIYCALSGFGLNGPDHDIPGYDLAAQARSGIMSVTGPLGGNPQRVSTALSDVVTGMCAALAVAAAVVRQRDDGRGDLIDVSLLDSDLALMAPRIAAFMAGDREPVPSGGTDSVLAVYQTFCTSDRDVAIAIGNDVLWQRFCVATALPDLASDERLRDNAGRRGHRAEVIARVSSKLSERKAEEWLTILGAHGIPCSLVKSLSEVVQDPQVVARGAVMAVPGSDQQLHSVHSPFRLGSIPTPRNERFPKLGDDTSTVLDELGFSRSEIAAMIATGAVYQNQPSGALA
ncbi:MAG: CaiB/BaiF CoA transferase family protein, partial [Bradyrhizobium sp.]